MFFNQSSSSNSSNSTYTYRPNPFHEGSFDLFKKDHRGNLSPIGKYSRLDDDEDQELTEKKVMNIVMKLNGERDLIPLGEQTRARLLYHIKCDTPTRKEVIFSAYTGKGVSKRNAILIMEE